MVLGNEHHAPTGRLYPPSSDVAGRDDRILTVQHRSSLDTGRRLQGDQRSMLRALIAHLMPVDDMAAAHTDDVLRYIEYLIANEGASPDLPLTMGEVYRTGCDLVQDHACRRYGCRVQAMAPGQQDLLIWDMLESSMDGFDRFSPAYFFHTLRRHIADAMQSGTITPN
jgi:hypothetical protein